MRAMEEKILSAGKILPGDILKVDSFLNQQIDADFLFGATEEFYRAFAGCGVTKILTIEASGIAVAFAAALHFHVPVVFAKKAKTANMSKDVYCSKVESYTHGCTYDVTISKEYLSENDRILIVDDFLARGSALGCLIDLVGQAGAGLVGCAIAIEKQYQGGGEELRAKGVRIESLAKIAAMNEKDGIRFC